MKITHFKPKFQPIQIVVETENDATVLQSILNSVVTDELTAAGMNMHEELLRSLATILK